MGALPSFTYNVAAGDPLDVNAGGLNIHPPSGFQLSDAAIYHAFHSYWLPNHALVYALVPGPEFHRSPRYAELPMGIWTGIERRRPSVRHQPEHLQLRS